MSRINTNVNVMTAQRVTGMNTKSLNTSLERLSTGLRINRGKDDPAGLIASENLRSEKAAIESAISNAQRADQVVNVAEGGLQEINSALVELQSLVTGSANEAGLSKEEKEANQQQVESILQTIDRISNNTSFQGTKLLNGDFDFQVAGKDANVQSLEINAAKIGSEPLKVQANITQSAQQAGVYMSLGGTLQLDDDADSTFSIEIGGSLGSRQLSFASGTTTSDMAAQINTFTDVTGIKAVAVNSGDQDGIKLVSTDYGSNEFVSVEVLDDGNASAGDGIYNLDSKNTNALGKTLGTPTTTTSDDQADAATATAFGIAVGDIGTLNVGDTRTVVAANGDQTVYTYQGAGTNSDHKFDVAVSVASTSALTSFASANDVIRDEGQDVTGTINGLAARGDGRTMSVKSDALDMSVTLKDNGAATTASATKTGIVDLVNITGGGAQFSIGPSVDATNSVRLGISSVSSREIGTTSFGAKTYSLSDLGGAGDLNVIDGNLEEAQDVVNKAIKSISAQRGRLGSFQKNIIGSTVNSMGVALENIAAAESAIRDTDFAKETAEMTRSQILSQASQTVLAQAKSQPMSVLSLL
ncbi:Flagellin D [Poriferisphaera corsica]|uniref:Flagellin n=1 Tax=Poriferisphaera corsica TaxID=2528020 RepID=A0A517YWC6_9BACT|nr:flagellin [Poriferisphaera corsica]QDU34509.1 Flagellin D [Poriferisphaera corsica]